MPSQQTNALVWLSLALIIGLPGVAEAQAATGIAVVDSASVARAAWARAAAALQHADSVTARLEVAHAATSWPVQPEYLWANAVLAARAHDTAGAVDALEAYAALGLGRDLRVEPSFRFLATAPDFIRLAAIRN